MTSFSLYELNQYLRQVITLNFPEPVWVSGEIAQINRSRGHFYLTLVQKDPDSGNIIAQSDAAFWERQYLSQKRKLGEGLDQILQQGLSVLLLVRVAFDERYGLKFHIEEVDLSYSLGELERIRRQTLLQLQEQGLLDKNRSLPLPLAIQRIAVLSSAGAAGYRDFEDQLHTNAYGLAFQTTLFPMAMQGMKVEEEGLLQLREITARTSEFDAVALIRGGGSKLDLAAFDAYNLCREMANMPLPLLVGIGHEVDETVADRVAHTSLKTPTAVAEFLIGHNLQLDAAFAEREIQIRQLITWRIQQEYIRLERNEQIVNLSVRSYLARQKQQLDFLENALYLADPRRILEKGYARITREGQTIRSAAELQAGDEITLHLQGGRAGARVNKTESDV